MRLNLTKQFQGHPREREPGSGATDIGQVMGSRRKVAELSLSLFTVVFIVFFPCLRNGYIYWFGDDPLFVFDNPHVNTGLTFDNVKWAFFSTERSNWFPLTWISYMVDCSLFGLKPWGFHLTNVLFHAANTALVFILLRKLTGAIWRSFVVALLFGLHPLRVESVAWIAERKDVLSTFFWVLTLLLYADYTQTQPGRRRTLYYILTLLTFACGLMTKAMLVTLPFVMLLLDWWPLSRTANRSSSSDHLGSAPIHPFSTSRRLLLEKIPFFLLVIAASVISYIPQKTWGFVQTFSSYSPGARVENVLVSYVRYVGKILWPSKLCHFYAHPGHWPLHVLVASLVFVVGVSIAVFTQRRKWPYLIVGWLWFVATLIPVIGIVQLGHQSLANRYVYIPTIGILWALIWWIYDITKNYRLAPSLWRGTLVAILIPYVVVTRKEISYFKDGITLWRHDVEVAGKGGLPQYALGLELAEHGRIDEAISELEDILKSEPKRGEVHVNLSSLLIRKQNWDKAAVHCREAMKWQPENPQSYFNLATIHQMQGRIDEAITNYFEAIQRDINYLAARFNVALLLLGKGRTDEAIIQLNEVVRIDPNRAQAHDKLGAVLGSKHRVDEAIYHFQEALRCNPGFAEAHNNLGVTLFNLRRMKEAAFHFQEAVKLRPDFKEAQRNLQAAQAAPKQ